MQEERPEESTRISQLYQFPIGQERRCREKINLGSLTIGGRPRRHVPFQIRPAATPNQGRPDVSTEPVSGQATDEVDDTCGLVAVGFDVDMTESRRHCGRGCHRVQQYDMMRFSWRATVDIAALVTKIVRGGRVASPPGR